MPHTLRLISPPMIWLSPPSPQMRHEPPCEPSMVEHGGLRRFEDRLAIPHKSNPLEPPSQRSTATNHKPSTANVPQLPGGQRPAALVGGSQSAQRRVLTLEALDALQRTTPHLQTQIALLLRLSAQGAPHDRWGSMCQHILGQHQAALAQRFACIAQMGLALPPTQRVPFGIFERLFALTAAQSGEVFEAVVGLSDWLAPQDALKRVQLMDHLLSHPENHAQHRLIFEDAQSLPVATLPVADRNAVMSFLWQASAHDRQRMRTACTHAITPRDAFTCREMVRMAVRLFPQEQVLTALEKMAEIAMPAQSLVFFLQQCDGLSATHALSMLALAVHTTSLVFRPWRLTDHRIFAVAATMPPHTMAALTAYLTHPILRDTTIDELGIWLQIAQDTEPVAMAWVMGELQHLPYGQSPHLAGQVTRALQTTPPAERSALVRGFSVLAMLRFTQPNDPTYLTMVCTLSAPCRSLLMAHLGAIYPIAYAAHTPWATLPRTLGDRVCDLVRLAAQHPARFLAEPTHRERFDAHVALSIGTHQGATHAAASREDLQGLRPNLRTNDAENAMEAFTHRMLREALARIDGLFGALFEGPACDEPGLIAASLQAIDAEITAQLQNSASPEHVMLQRVRGAATEADNARRTLFGAQTLSDNSASLSLNPPYVMGNGTRVPLGRLTAMVWYAINLYQAPGGNAAATHHERALMRAACIKNLAQCIEDDGHRVCNHGLVQRIIAPLYGRYPGLTAPIQSTPQAFVTQSASRAFRHLPNDAAPSHAAFSVWRTQALDDAASLYGAPSTALAEVRSIIAAYEAVTF